MLKTITKAALLITLTSSFSLAASNAELAKDIKQIRNAPLVKGGLETTSEFDARTKRLYEKYLNKTYRLEISVRNPTNTTDKLVTYNPDTEELTVSLPTLDKKLVWIPIDGDKKIKFLNFSYIQTEPSTIKSDSYSGRNGLGNQVKVERHVVTSIGVAVLGAGNRDMIPQRFSTTIVREKVRDILEKGKLVMEIKTDIQNLEEEPSLLLIDEDEGEPTMKRPVHVIHTKYMLPVRLISISLFDGKGTQVLQAQGVEQNTVVLDE